MLGPIWNTASQAQKLWGVFRKSSLVWLLDPCHPLLRILRAKAPGTYHHSLVVGSLSESAALQIGADARLTRVGALYHDIGKSNRPALFGENGFSSLHDTLDPVASAQSIIRHVADGLAIARAHGLPASVQSLIAQHHGTSLVGFFYQKATAAGQSVPDSMFRYPGPRPQSPEAGILMLADIVEAAVRASQPANRGGIAGVVSRLFEERWADGQLGDSGLSLADLNLIQAAFLESLQGVYHTRVAYPVQSDPAPSMPRSGLWMAGGPAIPAQV
ncbi:MAG: HDIG domain-containing metalloprotein [Anaerolineae bacterium]